MSIRPETKIGDFLFFSRKGPDTYAVEVLSVDDNLPDDIENINVVLTKEGKKVAYYSTRYERDVNNREKAIKIHGLNCTVCGFNFKNTYGELGADYVEVHHLKPLFSLDEEIVVNPKTDLVCLCANCHRMIHRNRSNILTPNELKRLIDQQK